MTGLFSAAIVACRPAADAGKILTIGAATSLRESVTDIAAEFERQTGTTVRLSFAASGTLRRQIEREAPIDLFLSADMLTLDALDRRAAIAPESRQIFAHNCLVVAVGVDSLTDSRQVNEISELTKLDRIAIGNPDTVPAGRYARAALERAGIYEQLVAADKLIFGEHVRQVLTYAQRREVDAALIYESDVQIAEEVEIALRIPTALTSPIVYGAAQIANSSMGETASAFLAFLNGDRAQAILEARGFRRVDMEPKCSDRPISQAPRAIP